MHSENIPGIRYLNGWDNNKSLDERITQFISSINNMTPETYVFIEHPGLDDPEMRSALFDQKNSLAPDRQAVTDIYTNKKVLDALHAKGVILISYVDLFKKK